MSRFLRVFVSLAAFISSSNLFAQQPSPSAQPSSESLPALVATEKVFTFSHFADASQITSILSQNEVKEQLISRVYGGGTFEFSALGTELLRHPLTDRLSEIRSRFPERSARGVGEAPTDRMDRSFLVRFLSSNGAEAAEKQLRDAGLIERASGIFRTKISADPLPSPTATGSPIPFNQYYMDAVKAPVSGITKKIVKPALVAVLDSGIYRNHPELSGALWKNAAEIPGNGIDDDKNGYVDDTFGANFTCKTEGSTDSECIEPTVHSDIKDNIGHGTHVTGIIAGRGPRFMGVAPQLKVLPVKGLDKIGGYSSWLAEGLIYATNEGADVINNSWGTNWYPGYVDEVVLDAINYARALGVVVTFAAGNENNDANWSVFAKHSEVIAVGAATVSRGLYSVADKKVRMIGRAYFSNVGAPIDLIAPGFEIWSSVSCPNFDTLEASKCNSTDKYYAEWSGTSMATPFVSAAAALVLSVNPQLNPDEVRQVLRSTAEDHFVQGVDALSGAGLIDVKAATDYASSLYRGERVGPVLGRIATPSVLRAIYAGQPLTVSIEIEGRGYSHYALDVFEELSNATVFSAPVSDPNNLQPTWTIDTHGYRPGRYLIRLSLYSKDGGSDEEVMEFDVESENVLEGPSLEYEEKLPDNRVSKVYNFGIRPDSNKLMLVQGIWTPEEVGSYWGTNSVRIKKLSLTANGFTPENSSTIELGDEKETIRASWDAKDSDWTSRILFPSPRSDSVGALEIVKRSNSSGQMIGSVGSFERRGEKYEYIPDSSGSGIHGLLIDFESNQTSFSAQEDLQVLSSKRGDRGVLLIRREGTPFHEIIASASNRCFGSPVLRTGLLAVLERSCSGEPNANLVLYRFNIDSKSFNESLTDPNYVGSVPFVPTLLPVTGAFAGLHDIQGDTILLENVQRDLYSSSTLSIVKLGNDVSLPVTTYIDSPNQYGLFENLPTYASLSPSLLIGDTVIYRDLRVSSFYSSGNGFDYNDMKSVLLQAFNIKTGETKLLSSNLAQCVYDSWYSRVGEQAYFYRWNWLVQDMQLMLISVPKSPLTVDQPTNKSEPQPGDATKTNNEIVPVKKPSSAECKNAKHKASAAKSKLKLKGKTMSLKRRSTLKFALNSANQTVSQCKQAGVLR